MRAAGLLLALSASAALLAGCAGRDQVDAADIESALQEEPLPKGYVDPYTAADKQYPCLRKSPFAPHDVTWSTTSDRGKILTLTGNNDDRELVLLRTWQLDPFRPVGVESLEILREYKCEVGK